MYGPGVVPLRRPVVRELVLGSAERRTNLALLLLTVLAVVTGSLNFAAGTRWGIVATVAHGAVGVGMLLLTRYKWRMVRRGMRLRRAASTWPSVVLGVTVVIAIVTGILHTSGLVLDYGPLDDMQVHVGAGLLAIPFTAWHVFARGNLPARRDLGRRNALRVGLLLSGAIAVYGTLEGAYRLFGLPGARRRFTGSYEEGSHAPERMPDIIWLTDPVPRIDRDVWRLEVVSGGATETYTHAELAGHRDRVTATIDCTVGWYAEQGWHGVRLSRLLDVPASARSVEVRSATGYFRRFPLRDVPDLLLAFGYEDRPLEARHGYPARLVVPGRRGFWWVKWVTRITVDDTPWWVQPPYPLQ